MEMRLAFSQMRLTYSEKQVTFIPTVSRIWKNARRIFGYSIPNRSKDARKVGNGSADLDCRNLQFGFSETHKNAKFLLFLLQNSSYFCIIMQISSLYAFFGSDKMLLVTSYYMYKLQFTRDKLNPPKGGRSVMRRWV